MNGRLRFLTANLWRGSADAAALARQVEELGVDVLAVQELGPDQARELAAVLPHGKLEPAEGWIGQGLALRRPGHVQSLPLPLREARVAQLSPTEWPGLARTVEVVNVHIHAPHSFPWWRTWPVRRGQVRSLVRYLDQAPPGARVVIGDFNATPIWPAYRRFARRLQDAARLHAAARGRLPARTWGPWAGAPRLLRIDHAFVGGLDVAEVRVVAVAGSDHSGLLVDLFAR
jgi:endonuclease/exonuclease/phosphatase family metal-dependent hydrolase